MILEERTYTLHPGKVGEYFSLYEKEGMAIQVPILGRLVGYFSSEIGELNQVVHMWAYESLEERTRRRAELMADPRWKAFVPKLLALVQKMETRILVPAPFSPLK
ncbi:MAG TPA: NIPSNAP family protein [Thermodesulfobacteriota bacterium]